MGMSVALAMLVASAEPQGNAAAPVNLLTRTCTADTAADATVCGKRGPNYRIDPDVLSADRARNTPDESRPALDVRIATKGCRASTKGCEDSGVLPVSTVALAVAEAGLLVLQGEDWREPFRTGPDAYEQYRTVKARARPRVTIGVGASASGGASERP